MGAVKRGSKKPCWYGKEDTSAEVATIESCLGMSTAATNSVKLAASTGIKPELVISSAGSVTTLNSADFQEHGRSNSKVVA